MIVHIHTNLWSVISKRMTKIVKLRIIGMLEDCGQSLYWRLNGFNNEKLVRCMFFCAWAALEGKRLGYAGRAICFQLCVNGNWGEILQLLGGVIKSQQTLTWTNFGSENWENLSNYFTLISFQLVCKLAEQNQLNEEEMQKGVDWTH